MKLESLKLEKFKDYALKKEQMFKLNGGRVRSGGGRALGTMNGRPCYFDYGFDSTTLDGLTVTFHNRSNIEYLDSQQDDPIDEFDDWITIP